MLTDHRKKRSVRLGRVLTGIALLPFLFSGYDKPDQLEQVMRRGNITMLTRNGASSYYLDADGPTGPEYELVREFCEYLGVDLEIQVANAFNELTGMLERFEGDLIAANLTRTPSRELQFNFGPDYVETTTEVVYRRGEEKPANLAALADRKIMIIAGTSYQEALEKSKLTLPTLEWEPRSDVGIEDLLLAISDGAIDATLIDSNIYQLNKAFYPRVTTAFSLPGALPQAWAFPAGPDDSLVQKAREFMRQARKNGRLQAINDQFYTKAGQLDQVDMFQFLKQVRKRLPPLTPIFQDAATAHELDWRLLAAIGYQESHWDPLASSYTGVRGVMMLTRRTAKQLGLTDRLDAEQSIEGGARYFKQLHRRIPDRIPEPDRSWMALAAYNMGMGHLNDARILTTKRGLEADKWKDVRESISLLSQEKWHSQTKYGYARGFETRQFVENIRSYYETLIWMDTRDHPLLLEL